MNLARKITSVVALLVSIILFCAYTTVYLIFGFGIGLQAGGMGVVFVLSQLFMALFNLVQMTRIVQEKKATHWFLVFILMIVNIIFLFIPLDMLSVYGIPRSLYYGFTAMFS